MRRVYPLWIEACKSGYNRSMNTKKAVWIGKPGKMKATLHSLSFRSEDQHSVFFILGHFTVRVIVIIVRVIV